jgi:uncharacterized membrane protein
MSAPNRDLADRRLEQALGNLLRVGVIISAVFVLIGGAIYLYRHGLESIDDPEGVEYLTIFKGEPAEFRHPEGIVEKAVELRGRGLIMLGLLILIATPVARVLFSAVGFVWERDWVYVAATLTVLSLLLLSLFMGHLIGEQTPARVSPQQSSNPREQITAGSYPVTFSPDGWMPEEQAAPHNGAFRAFLREADYFQ